MQQLQQPHKVHAWAHIAMGVASIARLARFLGSVPPTDLRAAFPAPSPISAGRRPLQEPHPQLYVHLEAGFGAQAAQIV